MTVDIRSRNRPNPLPVFRERGPECGARGFLKLRSVAGRTVVTGLQASSPLRLLSPRSPGSAAWIVAGTYGGGLVGGDHVRLNIDAGDRTCCLLGTQASTKVYRTVTESCRQELTATVGVDALLISVPDPVVCFSESRYEQTQRFTLADGAALVALDSFTSGRCGRGERWAMDLYQSKIEVMQTDRCIFRDVMRLDPIDGPIGSPIRMGRCDCFASLLVVGNSLQKACDGLLQFVRSRPVGGQLLIGASAIEDGVIIRVAGGSSEAVFTWLRERLSFLIGPLGGDYWSRKW